jgi:hypothetical protein
MQQFLNVFSPTTLAAAITSTTATSITITDATKVPSNPFFRIKIDSELMYCTAISGTTLTVVRGYESTTAATHLNGVTVTPELTAGTIRDLMVDYFGVGAFSSRPTAGILGRQYIANDVPLKYWDNGTNWQLLKDSLIIPNAPINTTSGWTNVNFQTGTTFGAYGDGAKVSALGTNGDQLQYSTHSITSPTSFTLECTVDLSGNVNRQFTYPMFGIMNSTSNKILVHSLIANNTSYEVFAETYTSNTGGTETNICTYLINQPIALLKIQLASGTLTLSASTDFIDFFQCYSGTFSTYFPSGVDKVLLGIDCTFANDGNNIPGNAYFHSLSGY